MINTGLLVKSELVGGIASERVSIESNTKEAQEPKQLEKPKQLETQKQIDNSSKEVLEEDVLKAIKDANKNLQFTGNEFEFSIHEKTKQIMVKVINAVTKEVVREIPSEKILDMVASMCETAGLFVDEKR